MTSIDDYSLRHGIWIRRYSIPLESYTFSSKGFFVTTSGVLCVQSISTIGDYFIDLFGKTLVLKRETCLALVIAFDLCFFGEET